MLRQRTSFWRRGTNGVRVGSTWPGGSEGATAMRNIDPCGRRRQPAACQVVSQSQRKHNRQPEKAGTNEDGYKSLLVFHVHEKEDDQNGFRESDSDSRCGMHGTQRYIRKADRGGKQYQQHGPNREISLRRDDVFAHMRDLS